MGKETYEYKYWIDEDEGLFFIELEDATRLVFSDGDEIEEGVTIMLDREKFLPIFEKQVNRNPDSKHIQFTFSRKEIAVTKHALKKIRKEMGK